MADKSGEWLTPDGLTLIKGWARDGLNVVEIAQNMKIGKTTLYTYMEKYPQIKEAVYSGREIADYNVENACYKAACGYFVEELSIDSSGQARKTKRWVPPNPAAFIFWMKNRCPDKWKDYRKDAGEQGTDRLDKVLDKIEGNI